MNWPFVTRGRYFRDLQAEQAKVLELRTDVAYWKTRCERLTDAALARAGAIHSPTMVDVPKRDGRDVMGSISSALSITEIDSRTMKKKVS